MEMAECPARIVVGGLCLLGMVSCGVLEAMPRGLGVPSQPAMAPAATPPLSDAKDAKPEAMTRPAGRTAVGATWSDAKDSKPEATTAEMRVEEWKAGLNPSERENVELKRTGGFVIGSLCDMLTVNEVCMSGESHGIIATDRGAMPFVLPCGFFDDEARDVDGDGHADLLVLEVQGAMISGVAVILDGPRGPTRLDIRSPLLQERAVGPGLVGWEDLGGKPCVRITDGEGYTEDWVWSGTGMALSTRP
jgi:hypothetical protein